MKNSYNTIVIGVDHGYAQIKTAHAIFKSGVTTYDKEPTFTHNMLTYEGRYYIIGDEHKEFTAMKMNDQDYDSSILSLVSAEPGSIEQVNTAAINAAQDGAVYFAWDANEGLSQGGTLLELTFKAIGYDEEGTLIYIDGADSDDSEFVFAKVSDDGMGGEEIPCVIFNGSVSVLNIVYGDVNGDGKVNIIDANMVRRYSAKMIDFDDYQLAAADVSGDEKVNVLDANYIRRYSAKLIDTFPVI